MFAKGQMANIMRQAQQMGEKMKDLQKQLADIEAEGVAAAGMVKITINGNREMVSIFIEDQAMQDKEMLEDLIVAAFNGALNDINDKIRQKTAELTGGLGLPPGALPL